MTSTKLSENSLESILRHMNVDTRFILTSKYSDLNQANQSAPLKIDTLLLSDTGLQINSYWYLLSDYPQCYQLTSNALKSENIRKTKSIGDAKKYLMAKLISGGTSGRHVAIRSIEFHKTSPFTEFHLASGLKFKPQIVKITRPLKVNNVMEPIRELLSIDVSIKFLEIDNLCLLDDPIVKSAKHLTYTRTAHPSELITMNYKRVHFIHVDQMSAREAFQLIILWKSGDYPIGQHFIIAQVDSENIKSILTDVLKYPGARTGVFKDSRTVPFCITIPIDDKKELNIYAGFIRRNFKKVTVVHFKIDKLGCAQDLD